jgi:carbon monoxide dehydrogenase subunit G
LTAGPAERPDRRENGLAEQTSGEIDIKASPKDVLEIITDFKAYPKWAKGVKKADVKKKDSKGRPSEVYLEAGQMGFNSKQTLKYSYKAKDGGLSWKSTKCEGVTKSVQGEYTLKEKDDGTHVSYKMKMELGMPVPGMVKRKAERMITDSALKGLKKEVERR